jgi:hypothetical protein
MKSMLSDIRQNEQEMNRSLQLLGEIPLDPSVDYCKIDEKENGENIYGKCDPKSHFPKCDTNYKLCYHRINRRDMWYDDIKQPHYYIDPRRVVCVPERAQCRTCTPGRYCLSEQRCILDDERYDACLKWY